MNKLQTLSLAGILATNIAYTQTPTPAHRFNGQTHLYQADTYNKIIHNNLDKIAIELSKGKLANTSSLPTDNAKRYLDRYQDGLIENGEATHYTISLKNNTFSIYSGAQGLSYVQFTSKDPLENIVKILGQ